VVKCKKPFYILPRATDSVYTGEEQENTIEKYKMKTKVHEKGYHNAS